MGGDSSGSASPNKLGRGEGGREGGRERGRRKRRERRREIDTKRRSNKTI